MIVARGAFVAIALLTLSPVALARAQTGADHPVALDQLSTPRSGTDASDLDISQPASPGSAASVVSNEISSGADSRLVTTRPVDGIDRCDPANGAPRTDTCRHRLETRAGEYGRPQPASVTPEGRLLLLINPNGPASTSRPLTGAGLDSATGPAEQLAGALRDQSAQDASTSGSAAAKQNALPTGVSPIVVLPSR